MHLFYNRFLEKVAYNQGLYSKDRVQRFKFIDLEEKPGYSNYKNTTYHLDDFGNYIDN